MQPTSKLHHLVRTILAPLTQRPGNRPQALSRVLFSIIERFFVTLPFACSGYVILTMLHASPIVTLPVLAVGLGLIQAIAVWAGRRGMSWSCPTKARMLTAKTFRRRFRPTFTYAKRTRKPLSVIIIDLDCLKTINETYGHSAGGAAVNTVNEVIRTVARGRSIVGQFGDDEFVLALPGVMAEEAWYVAEHIRLSVASAQIHASGVPQPFNMTVSLGIAELWHTHRTMRDLIRAADLALLQAKRLGRNQTHMAILGCHVEPVVAAFIRRNSCGPRLEAI